MPKRQPKHKRKHVAWANQTDPATGEQKRFCTTCLAFLPLDQFAPCHIQNGLLRCRTHANEQNKAAIQQCKRRARGLPGSVARIKTNVNQWISLQKQGWAKWTDADVEQALRMHDVDLNTETRRVRFRPRDKSLPFAVDNSVVSFFNYTKSKSGSDHCRQNWC